jgi:hypothetical protein
MSDPAFGAMACCATTVTAGLDAGRGEACRLCLRFGACATVLAGRGAAPAMDGGTGAAKGGRGAPAETGGPDPGDGGAGMAGSGNEGARPGPGAAMTGTGGGGTATMRRISTAARAVAICAANPEAATIERRKNLCGFIRFCSAKARPLVRGGKGAAATRHPMCSSCGHDSCLSLSLPRQVTQWQWLAYEQEPGALSRNHIPRGKTISWRMVRAFIAGTGAARASAASGSTCTAGSAAA